MRIARNTTHGLSKSPIYKVWKKMIYRCRNPNTINWMRYGGRGIQVTARWKHYVNFHRDMIDGYKKGLTIERIENDGDYEKANCRWATYKEQANNTRRNRAILINGEINNLTYWLDKYEITSTAFYARMKRGMSETEAITHPKRVRW